MGKTLFHLVGVDASGAVVARRTLKSGYIDREAIAEAGERPSMRCVPIKSEEQLELQAVHRVREQWVMRTTAVVNQMRKLLLERGLRAPKGRKHLEEVIPEIRAHADSKLSDLFLLLLRQLNQEREQLSTRILMDRPLPGTSF